MARYRITIFIDNRQALIDLVTKHHLHLLDHGAHRDGERFAVESIAEPGQIQKLEAEGYQVETHEDVDAVGKERQKEVGKGNRYLRN